MSEDKLLLAIDVGTQSARAIVFDLHGEIRDLEKIEIEPYFSEQPGWAEQDPQLYWDVVGQACRALWERDELHRKAIAGVALTTQRATVVNLDEQGRPLRPAIVWLDQRRTEQVAPIGGLWGLLFKLMGVKETIRSFQVQAPANWIALNQPEIWQQTHKCLLLSGYLSYKLSGQFVDSVGCQVGWIPFDFKRLDWCKAADWKWRGLPYERDHLPELVQPGERLGEITAAAAEHTGLPVGLPIIAAAADKACEVLGAGCVRPDEACLSYGTTATVNTSTEDYVEVTRFVPPYPAALPGAYNTEVQIYRGFWLVSWFKNQFARHEQKIAEERGIAPEALFDEMMTEVPPGSMGLTLQPYWSPGVREPGPEAKGGIIGFGDVHTRAHIYRAIIEGLAYSLREGLERIESRAKVKVKKLRVAGGGSQSDAVMQITADIFGRAVERPHTYETSALGAAMNAAVGLGFYRDYAAAEGGMTRLGKRFEPRGSAQDIYGKLYRRVYRRMYERLQPLYEEIRKITGYPP